MRGDFTRDIRERAVRLGTRAVLLQQGRQLLDQDWNAQAGLTAARAEQAALDIIGRQGAPREDAGFAITPATGSGGFRIGSGAIYAEGLRCDNPADVTYAGQVADGILPTLASQVADGARALVYLDAGTRPAITADDSFLADPGLGAGGDTVIHEMTGWTVRVATLSTIGMAEDALITAVDRNQPLPIIPFGQTTGGLDADVQTEDEATDPGPCELPPTAGYLDILNKLYRVEIHRSGPIGTAQFKWCDDAGLEAGIRAEGAGVMLDLLHAQASAFANGTIVELIDSDELRAGKPGQFGTIASSPGAPLEITGIAAGSLTPGRRLRRWSAMPVNVPAAGSWIVLDKGIKIRFAAGRYERGAGWTIPARTRINDICWPPYPTPDFVAAVTGQPNVGYYRPTDGQRRYAALAIIRRTGNTVVVENDLRQVFPPLTDLTADAVRYENNASGLEATNVQDALDELAARSCSQCTLTVTPGPDWADVFDAIPAGANATICFPAGRFALKETREIVGKGHIRLVGSGSGTLIWCMGAACALRFRNCRDVEVTDVVIAAEDRRTYNPGLGSRTLGALEIATCARVRVARATLIAGSRRWRQAACLRIDVPLEGVPGAGDVTVHDCDIVAGDLATGILILNARHARIRDNRIRGRNEKQETTRQRWSEDPMVSGWFGGLFFSNAGIEGKGYPDTRAEEGYEIFAFELGDIGSISAVTLRAVGRPVWEEFSRAYQQRGTALRILRNARVDVRELVGGLITSDGEIVARDLKFDGFKPATRRFFAALAPVIDTGIVVAGERAGDIAISGNAIAGALQGIRVGVDRGQPDERLRIDSVRVHDNFIRLPVVPLDRVRHGVYIGNARRAWVVDNDIAQSGSENPTPRETAALANYLGHIHSEGIRVSGMLGKMVQIRGNAIRDCAAGITVRATQRYNDQLRLAEGNLIENARRPWSELHGLDLVNNQPE